LGRVLYAVCLSPSARHRRERRNIECASLALKSGSECRVIRNGLN
jgi:hypothetical protein